jgi:hypothetical protein
MQILAVVAFLFLITMLDVPPHADATACVVSCTSATLTPSS